MQKIHTRLSKTKTECTSFTFCLILAGYFTLILNLPFIYKAYSFLMPTSSFITTPLLLSIPLLLFCVFIFIFSFLSIPYIEKPIFITLILSSSLLSYGYAYYGFIFEAHSPIFDTIEQTNWQELSPLITPSCLIFFFLFGIIPSYLIYKTKIQHFSFPKELLFKGLGIVIFCIFYLLILLPFFSAYQPLVRFSGLAARPPFQIIPTNFLENAFNHYHEKLVASYSSYQSIGLDAKNISHTTNKKKNLLVFVIGETARSKNFELNGYLRKTNFYTVKQGIISFLQATSCGTSTRISVPCIFSSLARAKFSVASANLEDNLLDILKRAGLNLFWIDNNGIGDCQGVCQHIESIIMQDFDEALVSQFSKKINQLHGKDSVIILHLQGSHGPNYYARYPEQFSQFKPDCKKNELRLCDQKSVMNSYDNSILYTDFVLNELIQELKNQKKYWNTALIYTSDHGESIGEYGVYGHCAPYLFAPQEQTNVPLLVWVSKAFRHEKKISLACLRNKATKKQVSHDNLFHSVLGLMDIETSIYQSQLDLFNSCRKNS